jgi:hypothetical protein
MFERRYQLSIVLDNKPGRFAEVCDNLYELGVDIQAMTLMPLGESGFIRMVVDNLEKAEEGLLQLEICFQKTEVLIALAPNQPGVAAGLAYRFSQAKVNIEYTYFSGGELGAQTLLVFKVADTERALKVLNDQADVYN